MEHASGLTPLQRKQPSLLDAQPAVAEVDVDVDVDVDDEVDDDVDELELCDVEVEVEEDVDVLELELTEVLELVLVESPVAPLPPVS